MHRLGLYRVRTSNQIFSRTPGSRSLQWAVTDGGGDGDGEGDITRFVSRTVINQSYDCQRIFDPEYGQNDPLRGPTFDQNFDFRGHISTFRAENTPESLAFVAKNDA